MTQRIPGTFGSGSGAPFFVQATKSNHSIDRRRTFGQQSTTRVASLNVQSRLTDDRLGELVAMCIKRGIDALTVIEHRLHAPQGALGDLVVIPLGGGWSLQYLPCSAMGQGGTGIILSPRAAKSLDSIRRVTDRIFTVQLSSQDGHSRLKTVIIGVYSPTGTRASTEASTEHHEILSDIIGEIPLGHMLIVNGDLNATLQPGTNGVRFTPRQHRANENTDLLHGLLCDRDLLAVNTLFRKPEHQLVTFYGPRRRRVCLDYVLCRSKWRSCFKNAFTFEGPIRSDHKVLVAEFRWRFASEHVKHVKRYDVSKLDDPATRLRFEQLVLDQIDADHVSSDSFTAAVASAMATALPLGPRRRDTVIRDDPAVVAARALVAHAATRDDRRVHQEALRLAYDEARTQYLLECGKRVSDGHINNQHRLAYVAINEMREFGGHRPECTFPADSPNDRLELIRTGLAKLYSIAADSDSDGGDDVETYEFMVPDNVVIKDEPFTTDELTTATKTLKRGKASDMGGLCAEVLKLPGLASTILSIMNAILLCATVPDAWLNSAMVLLYKKGDPADLGNYRSITLINLLMKLFMKLLQIRIADAIDQHLRFEQNGFRRGRSTTQHVLALRRLIEETELSKTGELYLLFVDFSKAFDTISWSQLWAILRAYRVPDTIIAAIKAAYVSSKAQVRTSDGLSGAFEFFAGVKQGCCLSPLLFIIVVDFIMRRAFDKISNLGVCVQARKSSRFPAQHVTDTGFADDIALVAPSMSSLQQLADAMVAEALHVGLRVNVPKTELMAIGASAAVAPTLLIYERPIKVVKDFKFLGAWIRSSSKDFTVRRALAWRAVIALPHIWASPSITNATKRKLFRAVIEPVLLYGSETWTMTASLARRLDGTYTRLLRACLQVTYLDRWTNVKLYGGLQRVSDVVNVRRIGFAGHCFRANQPVAKTLMYQADGPRRVGRPKMSYVDVLMAKTGATRGELPRLMADRDEWRIIIRKAAAGSSEF